MREEQNIGKAPVARQKTEPVFLKPFKEPRNRFPAWRNRFLGIDTWAPETFTNSGSEVLSESWTKELQRHQSLNVAFTGHFCLGW